MKIKIIALALSVGVLAACNQTMYAKPEASAGYVTDYAERVKAADWNKMQTVTVTLNEHSFEPGDLVLKANQPYKLEIKNTGKKHHYYTAEKFFRNVAWRKVMVNGQAEIKAPYFDAVEVLKDGGQLDLYFIPVNKGKYEVICTIDDHRDKGMEGSITIE